TVDKFGQISGRGTGQYTQLSWSLSGTNGSNGNFSCTPTVSANPFAVDVSGQMKARVVTLQLSLPSAQETNEETDCGAKFKANATRTTKIPDSLRKVGGGSIKFNKGQTSRTLTA